VKFLGHVIFSAGIAIDPQKIKFPSGQYQFIYVQEVQQLLGPVRFKLLTHILCTCIMYWLNLVQIAIITTENKPCDKVYHAFST